jgi:N-methylhydantoinase B
LTLTIGAGGGSIAYVDRAVRSAPGPACYAKGGDESTVTDPQFVLGRMDPELKELMRNTRNNPLEELGMHPPLICDRYEVRDDVPPGAGKFRGGGGVLKSQRYLTSGFMTHESDRNEDAPCWMIFGGKSGHGSKVELRNTVTREVSYQSAKFSRLRTNIGDTITHYSPIGGGYGAPLDRDPRRVLDDVLDGFITVGHARDDCGVVLIEVDDEYGWALNREASRKLRTEMAQA